MLGHLNSVGSPEQLPAIWWRRPRTQEASVPYFKHRTIGLSKEPWKQKRVTLSAKSERSSPGRGLAKEVTFEQSFEDRMEFPRVEKQVRGTQVSETV